MWRGSMRGGGRSGLLTVRCTRGVQGGEEGGAEDGPGDRPMAWRLRDGEVGGVISLDEADRILQGLG